MKKIIFLTLTAVFLLTGCTTKTSAEDLALTSEFNVTFDKLDEENQTAQFTVYGLANEEEFAQIETIINDSLSAKEIEDEYEVYVLSSIQEEDEEPMYGSTTYKDGKVDFSKLTNLTIDEYLQSDEIEESTDEDTEVDEQTDKEEA